MSSMLIAKALADGGRWQNRRQKQRGQQQRKLAKSSGRPSGKRRRTAGARRRTAQRGMRISRPLKRSPWSGRACRCMCFEVKGIGLACLPKAREVCTHHVRMQLTTCASYSVARQGFAVLKNGGITGRTGTCPHTSMLADEGYIDLVSPACSWSWQRRAAACARRGLHLGRPLRASSRSPPGWRPRTTRAPWA